MRQDTRASQSWALLRRNITPSLCSSPYARARRGFFYFLFWEEEETKFPGGYGTPMLLRPVTAAVFMETTKLLRSK
jgi:hypothetical protein